MPCTFIHSNIANLPWLAVLDVIETHYKETFVLQMSNATMWIIKHTCDRITSEIVYYANILSIYKNEFNKNLLGKLRLNNFFI